MACPKYYYHITQNKWPERLTLKPRIEGVNRSMDEPEVSRICVAPTIEGCLVALGCCLSICNYSYIYRTENKVLARNPYRVEDSSITKEKWITKQILFKKIGIINDYLPHELYYMGVGGYSNLKEQKAMLKKLNKMNLNFVDWV
jgi:hypothetical protein